MSNNKLGLIISEVLMVIALFAMFFGIYFGKLGDLQVRIIGVTIAIDLVMIVYNALKLKKR